MQRKLTFAGLTSFKDHISRYLDKNIFILKNNDYQHADVIYWIYGPGPDLFKLLGKWFHPNCHIIIHWVGSDVSYLTTRFKTKKLRQKLYNWVWKTLCQFKVKTGKLHHFTVATWLQKELETLGIQSTILPISSVYALPICVPMELKLPDKDFLTYIPCNRFDFYGGHLVIQMAKEMPECSFTIIHSDLSISEVAKINNYPKNVRILPHITNNEMTLLYQETKCYLRLTKHDGLSLSVLEALFFGQQVIWTCDYPHVHRVSYDNLDEIIQVARQIIGTWNSNINGREFIIQNFSEQAQQTRFDHSLNILLQGCKQKEV